jgi:hypothetical protein
MGGREGAGVDRAPRRAVYTALMNGYEELLPQPLAKESGLDFICFTDDPTLTSDHWEMALVEPALRGDGIRSARALKIEGHPRLAGYDETLWIDNRVELHAEPSELLDDWLAERDVAVPRHSYRADVLTEFQVVLVSGLDEAARLYEQLVHYTAHDRELLSQAVPWTGILARRRTPAVDAAMARWMRHVLRYSRRDQLSFVQAMAEAGLEWRTVSLDNHGSALHTWRLAPGRGTGPMAFRIAETLQPPVAEVGQLRHELDRTVATTSASIAALQKEVSDLTAANQRLLEEQRSDRIRIDRLRRRLRRVRAAAEATLAAQAARDAAQRPRVRARFRRRADEEGPH